MTVDKLQALTSEANQRRKERWDHIQSNEPVLASLLKDMERVFGRGNYKMTTYEVKP